MRFIRKTISFILIVLMLIGTIPLQMYEVEAAGMTAGTSGSMPLTDALTAPGGGISSESYDDHGVVISVYRNTKVLLRDSGGIDLIFNNMKYGLPETPEGGLYIYSAAQYNALLKPGVTVAVGEATGGNGFNKKAGQNDLAKIIGRSGSRKTGVYYDSLKGTGIDTFKQGWESKATKKAESLAVWSYITTPTVSGSSKTYHIDERINEVFNPDKLDYNKVSEWTDEQKDSAYKHYLDLLLTLYTLAEYNNKTPWKNAVNDYLNVRNLESSPISISIEPAVVVSTQLDKIAVKWADFMNYYAGVENIWAINKGTWWSNTTTRPADSLYNQFKLSVQESTKISSRASTSRI